MIMLTILAFILIVLIVTAVVTIGVGGSVFIIIFSDVIVCALFIAWLIKRLVNKKKNS